MSLEVADELTSVQNGSVGYPGYADPVPKPAGGAHARVYVYASKIKYVKEFDFEWGEMGATMFLQAGVLVSKSWYKNANPNRLVNEMSFFNSRRCTASPNRRIPSEND